MGWRWRFGWPTRRSAEEIAEAQLQENRDRCAREQARRRAEEDARWMRAMRALRRRHQRWDP